MSFNQYEWFYIYHVQAHDKYMLFLLYQNSSVQKFQIRHSVKFINPRPLTLGEFISLPICLLPWKGT